YLLLGGYGETGAPLTAAAAAAGYWRPREASGRISSDDDESEGFEWHSQSTSPIPSDLESPTPFKEFLGGGGAGIRLGDNTFVLPVQALKADGKRVSLVVLARGTSYGWKFSEGTSHDGCVLPAVLEWGGAGGLLMMASCADGSRRVYESASKGRGGRRRSAASRACGATH
ncbi:trans-sialidase, partial [Trypanosoma conorhini]